MEKSKRLKNYTEKKSLIELLIKMFDLDPKTINVRYEDKNK